jgi:hypothetical protein
MYGYKKKIGSPKRYKERILQQRSKLPEKLKSFVDKALYVKLRPCHFVRGFIGALRSLLFANWSREKVDESEGLHCDRDSESQVESAIRLLPWILTEKYEGAYPIVVQAQTRSGYLKTWSAVFVPVFAKLGIEFGYFETWQRGGLLIQNFNLLHKLCTGTCIRSKLKQSNETFGETLSHKFDLFHQLCIGTTILSDITPRETALIKTLKQLGEMRLLRKEDVAHYELLDRCGANSGRIRKLMRFKYLVDWYPDALVFDGIGYMPATVNSSHGCFEVWSTFSIALPHFPTEVGGLFHEDHRGRSPYRTLCKETRLLADESVKEMFEYHKNNVDSLLNCLVYAASQRRRHLDGVFLMVQRIVQVEPSVVLTAKFPDGTTFPKGKITNYMMNRKRKRIPP